MAQSPVSPGTLLHPLESLVDCLDWRVIFPVFQPVEIELGAGDGGFLADYAQRHPERNFLALERLQGRLRKIDRRGRRLGLPNLRGLRIEAGYFLAYLVKPATVAACHLYFPDPWPKRRHAHRRLVNPQFAGWVARALQPGGALFLRTDDVDYFAQMRTVLGTDHSFVASETPDELAAVVTDFERDFNARGVPTLRAAYRLAPPAYPSR